jgi:F0F1-type ATP synthase assembly protein I
MKGKEKKKSEKKEPPNQFLKYTGMATQMTVIILCGVFGGLYLDDQLQTETPWFTLAFSLLSVALAMFMTIRDLNR